MTDHRPFEALMRESLPESAAEVLLDTLGGGSSSATVSVRLNPFKVSGPGFLKDSFGEDIRPVPWCTDAFFLSGRPNFTLDPAFHAGAYYVQDSSSMFPALVSGLIAEAVKDNPDGGAVLDLCASPGGKSTHLISILKDFSPVIVCNEAVGKRVPPLTDNIAKWGAPNVIVTGTSAANLGRAEGFFDVILADVPCSGEGMWRKSEDAVEQWSLKTVQDCATLQRSIIKDIWPALREGGLLIYSTCTYNHFENQDNVRYIAEELGADYVPLKEDVLSMVNGLVRLPWGYQFVAGLVPGEGQFFAVLRKISASRPVNLKRRSKDAFTIDPVKGSQGLFLNKKSEELYLLEPYSGARMADLCVFLSEKSPSCIKMAGCKVGQIKAGKVVPDADLALSAAKVSAPEFFCAEIDRETAVKFLSRENITPQPDWPRGYILLRYQSLGLGFVNNLGNRTNNLHPLMRRILKVR
ncbi:MAG: rRNA cytosine-C5-methyltransferase [Bacteroidales bacterium]|nr:rRNA cytosine-C5-methyltransferase [Bacteroidales bacterium]